MIINVLTLFPEMFTGPLSTSILKRGIDKGLLTVNLINIRDYATDKHKTTDDIPYGGGAGMVMKPEPIFRAVDTLAEKRGGDPGPVILLCPQGTVFTQQKAQELAGLDEFTLLCGHYEGIDERVRTALVTDQISIGDYILTGGELPAMVVIDAVARLIPGVLGEQESYAIESFADGLLEYPQYTRPREFRGLSVPDVLFSGHHAQIARWRRKESLRRTLKYRPDLLAKAKLTPDDQKLLKEIQAEEQ